MNQITIKNKYFRFFLPILVIVINIVVTNFSYGQTKSDQLWNLKDVDLQTLTNEVSKITGKNFVIAPSAKLKVSFISNHPLSPDELYQAYLTLLKVNDLVAIDENGTIKIIREGSVDKSAGAVTKEPRQYSAQQMILMTYHVKNYSAEELAKILTPLVPSYSYIATYKPTNDILISDQRANIDKLIKVIKELDKPASDKVDIISLKHAQADDIKNVLAQLSQAQGSEGKSSNLLNNLKTATDSRANAVIISGGAQEQRSQLRTFIEKLDAPTNASDIADRTEVIYLKYIPAETIAPILQSIIYSYNQKKAKEQQQETAEPKIFEKTTATDSGPSINLRNPLSKSDNANALNASSANDFGKKFDNNVYKSGHTGDNIQWEQSTNSIIITAPPSLISKIKSVIAKLDIRRPQVLIEAIIVEVGFDLQKELGVEWTLNDSVNLQTRFNTNSNLTTTPLSTSIPLPLTVGTGLTLGYFPGNSFRVLLRALSQNNTSNILSTPNLLTLDNEPAEIRVGRKVSFSIGQIENNPTGGNPFTSFERSDVGLTLNIRPQITPENSIRLNIEQQLSSIIPGTANQRAGQNPDTTERYIRTTVMAENGQILVLGGLLQNEWQDLTSKVPVLGDLPGIGALFQNNQKGLKKSNLLIFIKPIILNNKASGEILSQGKYESIRQQQIALEQNRDQQIVNPVLKSQLGKLVLPPPFSP